MDETQCSQCETCQPCAALEIRGAWRSHKQLLSTSESRKLCSPERQSSAAAKSLMGQTHSRSCSQLFLHESLGLQPLWPVIMWYFKITKVKLSLSFSLSLYMYVCVFNYILEPNFFFLCGQVGAIFVIASISSEDTDQFGWKRSRSELVKTDLFQKSLGLFLLHAASTSAQIPFTISLQSHIKN